MSTNLYVHLRYSESGRGHSQKFLVPSLPPTGSIVTLPGSDDRWVVLPSEQRWEFCRGGLEDEQLATHVHLELELAPDQ